VIVREDETLRIDDEPRAEATLTERARLLLLRRRPEEALERLAEVMWIALAERPLRTAARTTRSPIDGVMAMIRESPRTVQASLPVSTS
jgi:hypothetical protein